MIKCLRGSSLVINSVTSLDMNFYFAGIIDKKKHILTSCYHSLFYDAIYLETSPENMTGPAASIFCVV